MTNPLSQLFWQFAQQRCFSIGLLFVLELGTSLLKLSLPLGLAITYGLLFDLSSVRGQLLSQWHILHVTDFMAALRIMAWLLAAYLVLHTLKLHVRGVLVEDILKQLRTTMFAHQLKMKLKVYEDEGVGRYLLRYSGDLGSVKQLLSKGVLQFAADLLALAIGLALICALHLNYGILIAVSLGLFLLALLAFNRRLYRLEESKRNAKSAMLGRINRSLISIGALKAFNKFTPEMTGLNKQIDRLNLTGKAYTHLLAWRSSTIEGGLYALIGGVLWSMHTETTAGGQNLPITFLALVVVLVSWRPIFHRICQVGLVWKKGRLSVSKIRQLLEKPTEALEPSNNPDAHLPYKLTIKNVSLRIGENREISPPNLTLAPGKRIILHAEAGAGKSILTKMLAGLYSPSEGKLLLGGVDISELGIKHWRKQITFISEAFPLYGKTILDALAYSPRHKARARKMLAQWQEQFPILADLSPDTPLRELQRLSNTQTQLLLWLRAKLTNKPIWVLDEPFQSIPAEMQQSLMKMIPKTAAVLLLTTKKPTTAQLGQRCTTLAMRG